MSGNDFNITGSLDSAREILSSDKTLAPQVRALIQLLIVIVELLANKLSLNSRNSSKPPSTDPNRPLGRRKKASGVKRKPGGQPGHPGAQLAPVKDPEVIDIIVSRQVTEYRAEVVKDERGNEFVAQFPKGVTRPVQYGADLKAKAVYMSQQQLIPFERIEDYFQSQCGIAPSTGSLFNFNKEAYELLETFEKSARQKLIASDIIHNDETGINVNGKLLWLHSASNEKWTQFFPHERRGTEAMKAMDILPHFKGISIHDHWKPYLRYSCHHALCNAHHLRELERAWEQDGQKWAKNMRRLLLKINEVVNKSGGKLSKKQAERWKKRYRSLLARANRECPEPRISGPAKRGRPKKNKARNLLERLRDYETEVLRFMTDERVPFTNNLGERDLRMTKVQQKISGCFRSLEGAKIFCRVRGYLSTCRKHGVQPTEALRLLFAGKLPTFIRSP